MKGILKYKLKSGALQFAVFIAVLIALILGGLVLYVYTFVYLKEQSKATIENVQLSDSGINYLLNQSETSEDTIAIPFFEKENQTVKVNLSQWGIFEKACVKTQHRKKIFIKTALLGAEIDSEKSPTLYLQETFTPLSLVGNAKIKGMVFLPSQGVKSGYIAGESYYGTQLIYGTTKKSGIQLPKIDKGCLEGLALYDKGYKPINRPLNINLSLNPKVVNSFKEKTKRLYSTNPIELEDTEIAGNIIIKSEVRIRIRKTALLKDIILIAPVIDIEDQVTGNFQVIATKSIKVGKECKLSYPSALILIQDNKINLSTPINAFDNQIFIDSGAIIKGSVCYFQTNQISDFKSQIVLEKQAKIKGQVYCQGNFELKGTVSGSVFTRQFMANLSGSVFVNHIFDGTIENENIPNLFGGILFEKEKKTILKWLY